MFLGRRNVLEPQPVIWGETKFQKTCNSMMSDIICKKVAFYVVCESQGGHWTIDFMFILSSTAYSYVFYVSYVFYMFYVFNVF